MPSVEDDEYDDERQPRRRDRAEIVDEAKRKTYMPAIFLIITGLISLGGAVWGFIALPHFDENIALQIKIFEGNPNIPAEQKKAQIEWMKSIAEAMKPFLMPVYIVVTIVAVLTIVGGVNLMNLKGRGLVLAGSILSMLPFTSGCCCLGLPFGIWAIVVLNNPLVRDGYAAVARANWSRTSTN